MQSGTPLFLKDAIVPISPGLQAYLDSDKVLQRFSSPQAVRWAEALTQIREGLGDFEPAFQALKPWRKGPYQLGEVMIDAEWDCSQKWSRIKLLIGDLSGQTVLDIGCNSGYFMFELSNHHPEWVLGIDPASIYWFQFQAVQSFYQKRNLMMLPVGFEAISLIGESYDLILCMGILYHHPEPVELLKLMLDHLKPGGRVVLETLVTDDAEDMMLVPEGRYARMKNVYAVPSVSCLERWCHESGYSTVSVEDVTRTTSQEQRVTQWSSQASLADFLDPADSTKTIEGYPGPVRAVLELVK